MENHPIENLMSTVMTNLKDMIDVNTIVGEKIEVGQTTIIPISKVSFGFAAGGSEFNSETMNEYMRNELDEEISYKLPFGGGSGAGINIKPIAFLVIDDKNDAKIIHLDNDTLGEKIVNYIPDIVNKITEIINNKVKKDCNCNHDYIEV